MELGQRQRQPPCGCSHQGQVRGQLQQGCYLSGPAQGQGWPPVGSPPWGHLLPLHRGGSARATHPGSVAGQEQGHLLPHQRQGVVLAQVQLHQELLERLLPHQGGWKEAPPMGQEQGQPRLLEHLLPL